MRPPRPLALTLLLLMMSMAWLMPGRPAQAQDVELTLPVYHLRVDSTVLAQLDENPGSSVTYPATFVVDGEEYACAVRYRGATARGLPKKSWRIDFGDDDNPFDAEILNLNAEYRDRSLMRNHLSMKLLQHLGYPAASTEHVSLYLNDTYAGVFLQVERIDEDFLERYDRPPGLLFKANDHAANMAPLLDERRYRYVWEIERGNLRDFRDLQAFFGRLTYWTVDEFAAHAEEAFDMEQLLTFYAVQYALVNLDGLMKNYYLYQDPRSGRRELFAWDMDASFGNNWLGDYAASRTLHPTLRFILTPPFQRALEYAGYRQTFSEAVARIAGEGFDYVLQAIDQTAQRIRHDVHQDTTKRGTNDDFEQALTDLKSFVEKRRTYLQQQQTPVRIPVSDLFVSNPFPTAAAPEVTVRVRSYEPQSLSMSYAVGLEPDASGGVPVLNLPLYDDGEHDDLQAGDLVYGNRLDASEALGHLLPFAIYAENGLPYPPQSAGCLTCTSTFSYALNATGGTLQAYGQLRFGSLLQAPGEAYLPLINPTADTLDLSGLYLQAGPYYQRWPIPPGTRLGGGDSLMLATNREAAARRFGDEAVAGSIFFTLAPGDTLRLLSPAHTLLVEAVAGAAAPLAEEAITINEINYHAADDLDAGDWVELFNPHHRDVDLSGWVFRDEQDDHTFSFPASLLIPARSFLVLSADRAAFQRVFPDAAPPVGDLGFGLGGGGDRLRLFNAYGELVDEVTYSDAAPWPEEADGEGFTLELTDADEDNSLAEQWAASLERGGTPGRRNSRATNAEEEPEVPADFSLGQNAPNPFTTATQITYVLSRSGHVELSVYDVLGRVVERLVDVDRLPAAYYVTWAPEDLASGLYFYVLKVDGEVVQVNKALYVR